MYNHNSGSKGGFATTLEAGGCGDERVQLAISSYLDGEASSVERAMAEYHLAECAACKLLVSAWGQAGARLRQSASGGGDPHFELMTRGITDQTRAWLATELAAPPVGAAAGPKRRQPSLGFRLGAIMTSLTVFVAVLSLGLSNLLATPEFKAVPLAAPTADYSAATLAAVSPATGGSWPAATPSVARANPNRSLLTTNSIRADQPQLNLSPESGGYNSLSFNGTPSVRPDTSSGRD